MKRAFLFFSGLFALGLILFFLFPKFFSSAVSYKSGDAASEEVKPAPSIPPLDKALYDQKLLELANNPSPKGPALALNAEETGEIGKEEKETPPAPLPKFLWPAQAVYPNAGAIIPFKRVVAYYGNLYSTKMGALGQYPEDEMLERLQAEVKKWEIADPNTPVQPALHYIAVVAQERGGKEGLHRLHMPESEIDKVIRMAEKINAIIFLDFQVGFSTLDRELPRYEKYFKLPNVHLGIDPEFSMKTGIRPGKIVGTYNAADINFAANFLAKIVQENGLTPKILVVHRYTQKMVANYHLIKPLPEVQIVMHMDGWGGKAKKLNTYNQFIHKEPVQFTGFKLFYKNDILEPGTTLFTPAELMELSPRPIYIQYQ